MRSACHLVDLLADVVHEREYVAQWHELIERVHALDVGSLWDRAVPPRGRLSRIQTIRKDPELSAVRACIANVVEHLQFRRPNARIGAVRLLDASAGSLIGPRKNVAPEILEVPIRERMRMRYRLRVLLVR